jgi:hypothetical protein
MTLLEYHCRELLRAYPAAYRRDRGEEIVGTLLEVTPPGRSWPLARDVRGMLTGGMRAHAAMSRQRTTAAGLRTAAVAGVAAYLASSAASYLFAASRGYAVPESLAAAVLLAAAVATRWLTRRRVVVPAVAIAAAVALLLTAHAMAPQNIWPATITGLACLAVLALFGSRARPSPRWLWLTGAAVLPSAGVSLPLYIVLVLPLIAIVVCSLLWCVVDARPAIAVAVYLTATMLPGGISSLQGDNVSVYPLLLAAAVTALAIWRLRRQSRRVTTRRGQ